LHRRDDDSSSVPVVLASASPRRRDLLGVLGISFSIQVADVDEAPLPGEGPEALARRLAQIKALTIARGGSPAARSDAFPDISRSSVESAWVGLTESPDVRVTIPADVVVLAADTVVVLDDVILGKPADDAEATSMLGALRGRVHRVLTGMALAMAGAIVRTSLVETRVWMREYEADEVERYVRSGSPLDKAGAYGIQDAGFRPVQRIEGCFTNVVGLPLCEVRAALTALDLERCWGPGWTSTVADESGPGPNGVDGCDACHLCERAQGL
jgi:septum formation protein